MTNDNLQRQVTLEDLGNFTEEVLLPRFSDLIDEKLANYPDKDYLEKRLDEKLAQYPTKHYLDDRLADQIVEFSRIFR